MRDVATVEGVVPQLSDAEAALGEVHGTPTGVLPATPGIVHRKASAGKARADKLTASDFEGEFPATDLRQPPPAPASWTPDQGFVELTDEEPASRMRIVRRRATPGFPGEPVDEVAEIEVADEVEDELADRRVVVRFVPVEGPRRVAPPRDLVEVVEQVTGVHVGDTVIDRSPAVTERAAEMGAVAFTEHGTVHLPAELGPIDDPGVRSVAAHELVHVAQHRMRAGDIPPEDTPQGRQLEAQAREVQRSVVPGAPVVPTFLRSETSRPVHRTEGPVGVQRLASQVTEYEGPDYSETDFSLIEPRSSEDIFAWQEREGEPTDAGWEERQAWAERFEESNSQRLQRLRDDYFRTLVEQAGQGLTEQQLPSIRQRLDTQMPYQFGSPFDVDPYPDVELPGEGGEGSGGVGGVGTGGAVGTRVAPVTRTPLTPLEQAESDASRRELRVLGAASRRQRTTVAPVEDLTYAELVDRLDQRRDRERELRMELLEAKRQAAEEENAPPGHVVPLTQDEIDEIRELVDLELPADAIDYLEQDDHASVTVAGAFGAFVVAQTPTLTHRRTGTPPSSSRSTGESSTSTSTGNAPGGGGENATEEPEGAAAQMLARLRETRFTAPVGDFELTFDDMVRLFTARSDREAALRREMLEAKLTDLGDDARLLPDDFAVCLTRDELEAIRLAVDAGWPQIVDMGVYLADDEFASLGIDRQWGPFIDDPESVEDGKARRRREEGDTGTGAAPQTTTAATGGGGVSAQAPAVRGNGEAGPQAGAVALAPAPTPQPVAAMVGGDDGISATAAQVGTGAEEDEVTVVEGLSEYDLDRLTRRMWTRIRRELRSELLIDRERAGVLADMR